MSQQAAKEIARNVEESNNKNASQLKGGMGGSGCSPELTKQATGTMVAVMGVVDKVNRALTTTGSGIFSDDSLLKIHENAKKTNDAALLNEYIAEQNYIVNNLIMDLIKVIQQQKLAVENMQKVMENLEENNEELLSMINGGKSDLYTYNRRSMYQNKLKESVENWTLIPVVVYWTLVILWVCIVMLYLKNVTTVSVLILIGLILYPYFSTPIFLWILEKIQMVWNFIFAAVHNRVSVYS
jgi:hypothetical protein